MKRTIVTGAFVGLVLAYALLAGGMFDISNAPSEETPRSHDVQVRSLGADATSVTVSVSRHGSVIMDREVAANDSFSQVLRLQGTGEFTVVVATERDSTTVELDRPARYADCTGDITLKFSVEANAVYLSTEQEPGQCYDP